MIKNYLKIAFRSLWRHKLYSTINILGLTFGMACVILISLYLLDELTFDRFHANADRIYRVLETKSSAQDGDQRLAGAPYNLTKVALNEVPEVEAAVRFASIGRTTLRNEESLNEFYVEMYFTEGSIWNVFDFQLKEGNPQTALSEPNTMVLSEETAQKLFGEESAMGKEIRTDRNLNFTVVGVMEAIPGNSHIQFPALFSLPTLKPLDFFKEIETSDWQSNSWTTYFKIKNKTNPDELASKVTALVVNNRKEELDYQSSYQLQALKDIHFHSEGIERDLNLQKGNISYVYIFSIVGFFILLIACINYMNLATARSSTYGKEVGVRKVIGARRKSLFSRFFVESLAMSALAFVLAINIVHLVLPSFNTFTGKAVSLSFSGQSYLLPTILGIVVIVSLLAGSYPALYLSRFNPASVLKGQNINQNSGAGLRQSLVVFQFILSTIMIIGTLVAFSQMQFIQNKNLGFNEDHLVVVDINSGQVRGGYSTIKEGYARLASVKDVTVSSRVPGEWKVLPQVDIRPVNRPESNGNMAYFLGIDENFLSTFEIKLLSGRNFEHGRSSDSTSIIINEQAAALLGIEQPGNQEFIIPTISFDSEERALNTPFKAKVIGIVKDFHYQSLHQTIKPMIMAYQNNPMHRIDYFTLRISNNNVDQTIGQLTDILHSVDPTHVFEYHFLDDQLQLFYETDQRRSQLFSMAALFAIFIACLGLFGLAAYMAEQRTKEIGIRKILGASVFNLIGLLSKDFLKLVVIALFIASPIAWYFASKWLGDFAYSVGISWWMFAIPGLAAIAIAILTVSFQSIRVATANPVDALRYE